ncbi:hypothetical protein CR513_28346, partial [Mucuna pruriens]
MPAFVEIFNMFPSASFITKEADFINRIEVLDPSDSGNHRQIHTEPANHCRELNTIRTIRTKSKLRPRPTRHTKCQLQIKSPRSITDLFPPQSPPDNKLKPLLDHLKYEEKLLKVLQQHKKAIRWKLFDLPGINPSICMHRILMEEEACPIKQQQRRLNPTILDIVKKEVTKLLAVRIIYPISDSDGSVWCKKLNLPTRKGHFCLTFLDQVLEKLAGNSHYCFLYGYSKYMQIHIAFQDQHKTTFTCPFGTFAYTRMPFGLCNAPSTFQRYMLNIFSDLLEECMEVFMDDFIVYTGTFDACLENLSRVLKMH